MKSINFEFLRRQRPVLADLGAFAEQYSAPDPESAAVKLRGFAEQITDFIYYENGFTKPFQSSFNDLLNATVFGHAVPRVIITKLHALRVAGNKAAHGGTVSASQAKYLLREAHDLGKWIAVNFDGAAVSAFEAFVDPPTLVVASKEDLQREKKAVLDRLAAAEAQTAQLLAELEGQRARATRAEKTAAEQQVALVAGQRAADALTLDEATTRFRLVDEMLVAAGWDVGRRGTSTASVGQEIEVQDQPTDTGTGFVDYVLWDEQSGKPLAVIEAKRTAIDPDVGRTQAKLYADALEKTHGQRPVIFYSNGYETWIWNDADDEAPRRVYGFYAVDNLAYLIYRRSHRLKPAEIKLKPSIAGRLYQTQAIRQVIERFAAKHRSALLVQATGTGKTRVAASLADALINARWAKRILFLCDRRELRRQASNVFKEHLPDDPRVVVTSETWKDRDCRIYLGTYPAMMQCFESFDVGFFDLIIADESHRSIYNRYRDLFLYFDGLKVGLTATPVDFIARNTYKLFGCEDYDPTFSFSYEEAINYAPPCLVPFEVETHTTPFLERGIKYSQMPDEQRRQVEEQEVEPDKIEYEPEQIDKAVFNKDTNRHVLRNLMDNGIKINAGTQIGKTIIFARSHHHAKLLEQLFNDMYPHLGGKFCRVIDNYDVRAEELIDEFKDPSKPLTIAVSVDMLDTGIDVPEVVNLVFAKPVFSRVKFWQMIGRGTRLCKDLFGSGQDKTHFLIFDHWKNFQFFDEQYVEAQPVVSKSLLQLVFESRIALAETALKKPDMPAFDLAIDLLAKDIADLPERSISVQEKWKQVLVVKNTATLKQFEPITLATLKQDIAQLMQWREVGNDLSSFALDNLIAKMQDELLRDSGRFQDHKDELLAQVEQLQMHLNPVKQRAETIAKIRTQAFWDSVTVPELEQVRQQLRGIMRYRLIPAGANLPPKVLDVKEDVSQIERKEYKPKLEGLQLAAYRKRVEQVLLDLFEKNATLQKIKAGQPVTEADLSSLVSLVLAQDADLDLTDLTDYYPETAGHLDLAIRSIIGLDAKAVAERFDTFVQKHSNMNSRQVKFLDLLRNHIAKYGAIELGRLYEDPFTLLDANGPDGIFQDDSQLNDLLSIVETFAPPKPAPTTQPTEEQQP